MLSPSQCCSRFSHSWLSNYCPKWRKKTSVRAVHTNTCMIESINPHLWLSNYCPKWRKKTSVRAVHTNTCMIESINHNSLCCEQQIGVDVGKKASPIAQDTCVWTAYCLLDLQCFCTLILSIVGKYAGIIASSMFFGRFIGRYGIHYMSVCLLDVQVTSSLLYAATTYTL